MTEQLPPQDSQNAGDVLKRVHQLGSAAETLFSRIYTGLNRRSDLAEAQQTIANLTEQAQSIEDRSRRLRQALKEKNIEVERLQAILANISEGIIMQDPEGRILMMNSTAQEMIGNVRTFWSTPLGMMFNATRDVRPSPAELAPLTEAQHIEIGNKVISAQIASIADKEGSHIGTMMILRDVTRDELAQRLKRSFVTHISHELITPLQPLRVASEILLNTPKDQPANRRMLEMIGRNIDILERMVSEMIDMSAMTSGNFQIRREPLNLEDLLWDVIKAFQVDVKEAKLDLTVMLRDTDALKIMGDHKHLRWTLSNLVRNAIQYNEPKEHIIVAAGVRSYHPNDLFIEVIDSGVGISETDMPHIFDLFFRGEPRTENGKRIDPRGLGQGLFVAKTVAQAHGGDLTASSKLYEGSHFTLTLPRHLDASLPTGVSD